MLFVATSRAIVPMKWRRNPGKDELRRAKSTRIRGYAQLGVGSRGTVNMWMEWDAGQRLGGSHEKGMGSLSGIRNAAWWVGLVRVWLTESFLMISSSQDEDFWEGILGRCPRARSEVGLGGMVIAKGSARESFIIILADCISHSNHNISRLIFSDLEIYDYISSLPRQRTRFHPLIVHLTTLLRSITVNGSDMSPF